MKIITKLFSLATLALGLFLAPMAQAWPISLYILVNKELKHINVLIGEQHANNAQDKKEALFIKLTQEEFDKLLANQNIAFIIEGSEEIAQTIYQDMNKKNTVENLSFLNKLRLYSTPEHSKACNALLSCSDWRTKSIFSVLLFFMNEFDKAALKLKNKNLKLITDYYQANLEKTKEMDSLYPKLQKTSPIAFIAKINHYSDVFYPIKEKLLKNYAVFWEELEKSTKENDCSLTTLEQEIEHLCIRAEKEIHNTTPNRKKLSVEIIKQLNQSYKDIKELHNNSSKQFLETVINTAKETNDFKIFNFKTLLELPWFKTLLSALADYGFIMGIKTSYPQHPITITYGGDAHIENIAKHFIEEEQYKIVYTAPKESNKALTNDDYSQFFDQLATSQKEIIEAENSTSDRMNAPRSNLVVRKKLIFDHK